MIVTVFAVFYVCLYFFFYHNDYLGQSPVLDGRENLSLAGQIAEGNFAEEPFYRAMFYPWVLGQIGASTLSALALGMLCHLASACLLGGIARIIWRSPAAAWTACLLYMIYPVALFFAGQALDITLATSLFLAATLLYLRSFDVDGKKMFLQLAGAGLLYGLAVVTRPNFMPVLLVVPLCFVAVRWLSQSERSYRVLALGMVVLGLGSWLPLLAQGLLNQRLSGEFQILPWQGAYNLYAANREGANGKFYMQRLAFDAVPEGMNPTRMESVYLYRQAHPDSGPNPPIHSMNSYWRGKMVEELQQDPLSWGGLMLRKVVYLFNDWEQYNNLSYPYHKERLDLLAWNPLGWGVLILGALGGVWLGWGRLQKPEASALLLIGLAYAAGVLLFFVSARFRLPLAPLLVVACSGLAVVPWRTFNRRALAPLIVVLLVVATVTFGNWFEARDRASFIQDELLLANAALRVGEDPAAARFAQAGLTRDPARQDLRRLLVTAQFNQWLVAEGAEAVAIWDALTNSLPQLEADDAGTLFIHGLVQWRSGEQESAIQIWQSGVARFPAEAQSCARALQAAGAERFFPDKDAMLQQVRELLSSGAQD
ncbi:MAG: hypothetical protein ACPGSB_11430 [Opitutales bacterium]